MGCTVGRCICDRYYGLADCASTPLLNPNQRQIPGAKPPPYIITLMSASSIPNLLSLRGGTRGGRGRGRGRGGHQPAGSSQGHDAVIQGTDSDAAISRLSAVELGYLEDSFAEYFVRGGSGPPTRRLPIINRGQLCPRTSSAITNN